MRDIVTGEPTGVHRTALLPNGSKIGRKALGPKSGACIKLSPEREVHDELSIAEGVETALAGLAFDLGPVWSVIDASGVRSFPVLGIARLTILVRTG